MGSIALHSPGSIALSTPTTPTVIRDTEDTLFFQSTNGKVYANFADENSAGSDGGDNPKENTYLEWIASPS